MLENISEVACIRFYVMGFRADWKAFKQVFNLKRHYNVDEVRFFSQTSIQVCCIQFTYMVVFLNIYIYIHISDHALHADMLAVRSEQGSSRLKQMLHGPVCFGELAADLAEDKSVGHRACVCSASWFLPIDGIPGPPPCV